MAILYQNWRLHSQQLPIDSLRKITESEEFRHSKNDSNKVNTLNDLAWLLLNTGDYTSSLNYGNQALYTASICSFNKGGAKALNIIGASYYRLSDLEKALEYYQMSLKVRMDLDDKLGIAASYNNIGLVYYSIGNYPESLKNHYAALKIRGELDDKKGIATSLNNIGIVYEKQGNFTEALKNHFACLEIQKQLNDPYAIAYAKNNIGNVYYVMGRFQEALEIHREVLILRTEIQDYNGIAYTYLSMGLIYDSQGDSARAKGSTSLAMLDFYPKALANHQQCLDITTSLGDKVGEASANCNIGLVNIKLHRYSEAIRYLNNSIKLNQEVNYLEGMKECYFGLALVDSTMGNFRQAFNDYKMFIVYRDSLVNEENLTKTVQLRTRYELEMEQYIKEQEEIKRAQEEKARVFRRNLLQYTLIFLFVMLTLVLVMALGYIKVSPKVARALIFISLLLVFEFILVFLDPWLDILTKGIPVYKLMINVVLATLIFPVHAFLEARFKKRLTLK